jgi:pyruvate dehydrogenase E2 component (dihydrolipoamide acetyltransferase)
VVHVVMPQFGETVAEGELTRWLVSVGDTVTVDQPIAEISTDKVDTEVVASDAGQVTALLADVGSVVAVGAPLLELDGPGGGTAVTTSADESLSHPPVTAANAPRSSVERPRSTPKARRIAREMGIDVGSLASGSRVVRAGDVVASMAAAPTAVAAPSAQKASSADEQVAAAAAPNPPAPGQYLIQHSRVRRITAQRTRDSLSVAATAWSVVEVDYGNVDASRKRLSADWKARFGTSLTYLPYVLRAVSLALLQYPRLNAEYRDDGLLVNEAVNLGVAVDLGDGGLSVPVLRDATRLSVAEIAVEMTRIAGAARSGTLGADDYAGSTFAVTNNGSYGSVLTMPVINQPNVGILSFDAVTPQPAVVTLSDGSFGIGVRPKGALALSWDHRAIDGAYAAKFLTAVKSLLETTSWDVSLPR